MASRGGIHAWSDSIANDIASPAAAPIAMRSAGTARRGISATNAPNGRYAITLAATSKRGQRARPGEKSQNGASFGGAIQSPNGCRLA